MPNKKDFVTEVIDKDMKDMGWVKTKDKPLGEGHFAYVYAVKKERKVDKDDPVPVGTEAACKVLKKPKEEKKAANLKTEHRALVEADHEYVVKCYDAFETDIYMYLFLENMTGGELFDRIVDMGHFTELQAQQTTFKLLSAIKYMHDKGLAHRDLKPENMLMKAKKDEPDGDVCKITDFGLSKFFDEQSTLMKTPCGTPGYIAPEVLRMKGYDQKCDIWSLGVIVYILLCGFPPFYADNDAQLFEKIKQGKYEFLKPYWDPISDAAKDFIRKMLVVDVTKRQTADQLLADPWLQEEAKKTALSTPAELPKNMQSLKKLKGAFLAAWATVSTARGSSSDGS